MAVAVQVHTGQGENMSEATGPFWSHERLLTPRPLTRALIAAPGENRYSHLRRDLSNWLRSDE